MRAVPGRVVTRRPEDALEDAVEVAAARGAEHPNGLDVDVPVHACDADAVVGGGADGAGHVRAVCGAPRNLGGIIDVARAGMVRRPPVPEVRAHTPLDVRMRE